MRALDWVPGRQGVVVDLGISAKLPLVLSPDEPDQALVDDTSKQDVDSTVTVGAAPKAPRWPGRRTRLIAAGVAGLLLLGGSGGVWARQSETHLLTQLTADFQAGQAQLEAGKALLKTANSQHEVADIDRADADFKAAGKEFQAAKSVVTQNSLVSVGEHLPGISGYLDPRVSAAINLCDMGSSLAAAAIDAGEVDRLLIQPDPNGAKGGAKLVQVLASAQPLVTKAHNDLTAASTSLARVNRSVLPAAQAHLLGTAQDTITKGLAGLAEFTSLVPAIVDILGGNGPRTYLLEQVNPAELRPGGGFMGSYSLVSADQGKLTLLASHGLGSLAGGPSVDPYRPYLGSPGYVAPPNVLKGFLSGQSWALEDSNIFPDFADNAKAGTMFANHFPDPTLDAKVDGVVALDYYTIAAMLSVTGPVDVPGDATYDSTNFVGAVLLASDDRTSTHKTILSDAAGAVLQKIAELPPASWTTLIQVLNTEQAEHHLQVFFNNPKVETSVSSLGWTSNLNPTAQPDFLMEVEANLAGDKANQDLVRAYHITLTQAGTTLHHQVVVDLTNNNPANATWGTNYDTYVRFYTEAGATNLKLSDGTAVGNQWWPLQPQDYPDKDVPAGFQIQDGYLQLDHLEAPSNHYQLIFDYDTTYQPNAQGTYSIYWQKEPGTMADPIDITWQTGGQTYKASGDLSVDRSIVLSATTIQLGVGQTSNAQIPGVSFG